MTDATATVREMWLDLLEKDDRTSPAEYPDMALITYDEFAALLESAERRNAELTRERDDIRIERNAALADCHQWNDLAGAVQLALDPEHGRAILTTEFSASISVLRERAEFATRRNAALMRRVAELDKALTALVNWPKSHEAMTRARAALATQAPPTSSTEGKME
jgi:hypothetical protein